MRNGDVVGGVGGFRDRTLRATTHSLTHPSLVGVLWTDGGWAGGSTVEQREMDGKLRFNFPDASSLGRTGQGRAISPHFGCRMKLFEDCPCLTSPRSLLSGGGGHPRIRD